MSFKAIILLTRAADATHEQFADWWLKNHAPLAKQLPELRRGVFNLVENPAEGDPDGGVRARAEAGWVFGIHGFIAAR